MDKVLFAVLAVLFAIATSYLLSRTLVPVLANYLRLLRAQKNLIWFNSFFGQAAVVFPFLVAAPRFFSGAIQLGELMQIASAFGRVQDSLSWFVDNYDKLAVWRATTGRWATATWPRAGPTITTPARART